MSDEPERCSPLRRYGWLLAAMALALVIQCSVAARSPVIAKDGTLYIRMARQLHRPWTTFRGQSQHPGYPAMILAAHAVTRPLGPEDQRQGWIAAARLASGICGLLCVAAVWLLTHRVYDLRAANVAAIIFAALPVVRQNAADTLSDAPHLLFYTLATWMSCEGLVRRRTIWYFAAGAASGLAYWIRPEGWSVVIVVGGMLLYWAIRDERTARREQLMGLAAFVLAAILVSAPYVAVSGTLSRKIADKFAPKGDVVQAVVQKQHHASGLKKIAPPTTAGLKASTTTKPRPPGRGYGRIEKCAAAFFQAWGALITEYVRRLHILILPLGLALFLRGPCVPERRSVAVIIALGLFQAMLLILLYIFGGYIDRRHIIPLAAVAMPLIAAGIIDLADRIRIPNSEFRIPVAALVTLLVLGMLPWSLRPLHREHFAQLEAAAWIRDRLRPGDQLVSNSPIIQFYAGAEDKVLEQGCDVQTKLTVDPALSARKYIVLDVGESENFDPHWLEFARSHCRLEHKVNGRGPWRNRSVLVFTQ